MRHVLATAVVFGLVAMPAMAAEDQKPALEIGDPAPAWTDLKGVDGEQHSLADLKDAKAVVVVFTCNSCPVAKAYEDRLIELTKEYEEKGVAVVAINVNNVEADRLPAMKERAKEQEFNFAYLYDPSQKIGRKFGATVTPHAFVLNGKHQVVYMGAVDDNMNAEKVQTHYVRDAVDAVLAGETPKLAQTKQFGCGIKYE